MVQSVESRIHKLLLEHGDSLKVADALLKDWDGGNLSWAEQNSVGHFLIKCGFFLAYFDQVSKNFKTGQKVPWSSFAEALARTKTPLSKDDFDQIFVGASEEQSLKDLVKCTKHDRHEPRFQKIRNSMDNTVMRAEMHPITASLVNSLASYSLVRESQTQTVQKHHSKKAIKEYDPNLTDSLIQRLELNKDDESTLRTSAKNVFLKALAEEPGKEKEVAIALAMMGAWQEGLEILQNAGSSFQNDLLKLEFLLQADKNVDVLDLAVNLFAHTPNLNQKSYIQFIQAQALINLKKPKEARAILENLTAENPEHSAARTLLNQIRITKK